MFHCEKKRKKSVQYYQVTEANMSLCSESGSSEQTKQTYLLAAVESLTFFPSKEAKCCSRASSRLLGA